LSYAQRVELDAKYVNDWSLWLDIKILAKTVSAVISGEGSR
jgi:lipopolysaccharide/colanic/teichoic acid biosynthesis glycosyltransferase